MKRLIPLLIFPLFVPLIIPFNVYAQGIIDDDLIRAQNSIDVYIVKIVSSTSSGQANQFKRLILNPEIFNQYSHLKWENIKTVSQIQLDEYTTSDLVSSVGDEKVYKLYPDGDIGAKRWIKTADDFNGFGYDADAIYTINNFERDFYNSGEDLTYQAPETPPTPPASRTIPITINVPADYSTIQSAIDAAINGDTISIANGTYKENIVINKGVKLISAVHYSLTVIDGQGSDSAITVNGADDFSIQKLTIKSQNQKAIYCPGTNKTKGIIKNVIINDSKWGIYAENNCDLKIYNNILYNNRSSDNKDGGGIFLKDNSAFGFVAEIKNNTIDDNHHGIWSENSSVKIINNIVSSNMGSGSSTGINRKDGTMDNSYNDVWSNGYDYAGRSPVGEGSISVEPKFVGARQRDYRLTRGTSATQSPCIDTGHPNIIYNDGKLLSSSVERADIGAYGGPDNIGWDL
jgi:parallel beta-helix repeat protein